MSTGRLGIVTIVDNDNFGNRLQNHALQECLTGRGWRVETIPNSPRPMRRSLLAARAVAAVRADGPVTFARRNTSLFLHRRREAARDASAGQVTDTTRRAAIRSFTTQHIHQLDLDFHDLPAPEALADRYDHVIVGSDQVWNPGFRQANEIDFLTFVRPEQRLAYAASFGVPEVPPFLRRRYSRWLTEIPHLSVREHRAAEIVRDLTGRDVPVVADPTLLLDPRHWHASAQTPAALEGVRYLATFFLGGQSLQEKEALTAYAEGEDLEVVDLLHPTDAELRAMSPLQFLGALRSAAIVATDSFHASVFSLVFERPSITKSRHADDTRVQTLFAHAGIERRRWRLDTLRHTEEPDWAGTRSRLAAHRQESWRFVEDAIGPTAPAKGDP